MKKPLLVSVLGAVVVGLIGSAQAGVKLKVNHGVLGFSAGGYHSSGYGAGYVIKRVVCGYDRYRRPIYRSVRVPARRGSSHYGNTSRNQRFSSGSQVSHGRLARR